MKASFFRLISQLLILSLIAFPFPARAVLIGTDAIVATAPAPDERGRVRGFVARAEVQDRLMTLGVNPDTVKERVNALTDEEVQQLAGSIDTLPAGGHGGVGLLVIVLLVLVLVLMLQR